MLKKLLLSTLLTIAIVVGYGYYKYSNFMQQKITPPQDNILIVEKGTSSRKLATLLEEKGIAKDTALLPYFVRLNPELNNFKAGAYSLENITTAEDLLKHINSGKEMQLTLQLIEGKTFKDLRNSLSHAKYLKQTLTGKSEQEIAKLLNIPHEKLEGWFAANTYHYTPYSTDLELLQRLYNVQKTALDKNWQNRDKNLPLASPYEMLILASIVEKETAVHSERPQVASVFINRLRLGMKLQTDPTVIYGIGDSYDGNIRKKDLLTPTPYNTYVIAGLPPTPIAMPSPAAIKAVAHPDQTQYLYFVADGTGGHKFTKSLKEHNQAVQDYLKWLRQQKGK